MNESETLTEIGLPETAAEALVRWDAGKSLFSPEMGGLGPGYEQAIQVCIFEILRECVGRPWTKDDLEAFKALAEKGISRSDKWVGGHSGAQVGAAKSVAWNTLRKGWRAALNELPKDRLIQVSRNFPSPPEARRDA